VPLKNPDFSLEKRGPAAWIRKNPKKCPFLLRNELALSAVYTDQEAQEHLAWLGDCGLGERDCSNQPGFTAFLHRPRTT